MIKSKSTLAKLLAEEDIFVVHKKMDTAYFNTKSRELGLPIWKDEEMTSDIYDLMVCHEIAHALWTPLDMIEKAQVRKINLSFLNIIEDARIERMVQDRYPGSVSVFTRGYRDLTAKDFFDTASKKISDLNLIDRINLFFKKQKVEFTAEEMVWVKRVAETKTPNDVINLAEELYAWMVENVLEEDGKDMSDSNGESDEGETGENSTSPDDDADEGETGKNDAAQKDGDDDDTGNGDTGDDTEKNSENGGVGSTNGPNTIKAETDTDINKAIEKLIDKSAADRTYARIPVVPDDIIMSYSEILNKVQPIYAKRGLSEWASARKSEVATMKDESKKTVAYMIKEFEMKRSADQYARAAVSKTGSLDMSRLHAYKYNEDIFKKVTILPGATNHGMVMVVDWSGSMYDNLQGTLSQLFNLIWFCRRTKIPFEVFAFSDRPELFPSTYSGISGEDTGMNVFKAGDLCLTRFKLLEFFSSKMSVKEEIEMMEILWMTAPHRNCQFNDMIWTPALLQLGGTPLNDAIIAMMKIVPKFKRETGVQKVNTIFLTDGASFSMQGVYDYQLNRSTGNHTETITTLRGKVMISDPETLKTYEVSVLDMTNGLLRILKNHVPDMNLIGFFIAGSGRSGRVDKRVLYSLQRDLTLSKIMEQIQFINKNRFLAIATTGYDELYVLPAKGLMIDNEGLSDDLIGASRAKLTNAFGKAMKGRVESRVLLNKFVKLVA